MKPAVDHIDVTVRNLERAERFYDRLLPLLGFDLNAKEYTSVPEHEYRIVEYHSGAFSFGLVSERRAYAGDKVTRRRAGSLHHLAFRADSKEEVDALYGEVLKIPARVVRPPQYYPEYCQDYYAFFIKDTEGIEVEVVNFDRQKYFPAIRRI